MKKKFAKKNAENSEIFAKTFENNEPFTDEFLKGLHEILKYKIFDKTILHESLQKDYGQFFSFEYFKLFLNDLKFNGTANNPLFLSSNQKVTATIIFEVISPLIPNFNVKNYYQCFCYYKNKKFKVVNYNCITSEKNKEKLPLLLKQIEDLRKSYDTLK